MRKTMKEGRKCGNAEKFKKILSPVFSEPVEVEPLFQLLVFSGANMLCTVDVPIRISRYVLLHTGGRVCCIFPESRL